jgi:N6-adenosine-specific RNA methylase IME4
MGKAAIGPTDAEFHAEQEARLVSAVAEAFVTAGEALRAIRDKRTYKTVAGFDNFEDYCRVRWQMDRSHAYRLIRCTEVMECLSVEGLPHHPGNAWITQELCPLLPEPSLLSEAWTEAVETAPKDGEQPIITAKHVKAVVRKYRHQADEEGEFPRTGYRILYADPPWKYSDKLIEGYGGAEHHYPPMSIDELCEMTDKNERPVQDLPATDAVLFLWVTSPLLEDCFRVIGAWGFDYKTSFVWDKVRHNYGHYNSVRHELLLIATRGSCTPDSKELHDSVVTIERSARHSEKPEEFRQMIDTMYPPPEGENDRIELFSRKDVPHWDRHGNQLI